VTFRSIRAALALVCATGVAVLPANPAQADRVRDNQWHLKYLRVAEAHRISQGAGIIVAVIDTGVYPHADLRNNLLAGTNVIPGQSDRDTRDTKGHGTAMAGLIAAHGTRDNNGALGIAPRAKLLPVKALPEAEDDGDPEDIAAGIRWAVRHKASIINLSVGGSLSPNLAAAVQEAVAADVVLIAGAGNAPRSFGVSFPALLDGVVAVGAVDQKGLHAAVSVKGNKLGIVAPGVDIHSTSANGKYQIATGTSDATAIVAGAAALVRSKFPNLSAEEVVHRLTATATDKGLPGRDPEYGYGVLNLVAALTADVPPLAGGASPSATASAQPTPSLVAATPMPDREPTGGRGAILVTVGVLVAAGMVVTLLVLRSRRRQPS
jgi:type VII secretion-associated serine protease mycosin